MEGPSPGRGCAALGNFSQLMTLKGLKDAGILTQKQFEDQVQETLTPGDAPTVAPLIKKRAHAPLLRTASQVVPRNPNPNPNANGRPLFEQDVE